MAKKNSLSSLTKQLPAANLVSSATSLSGGSAGTLKVSRSNAAKTTSFSLRDSPQSISFGSPSSTSSSSSSSQSGSEWSKLVKQTASSRLGSVLSGFSLFSGLSSLVSGITNLFNGGSSSSNTSKSSLPELIRFTLPASKQATVYTSASGTSVYSGGVSRSVGTQKTGEGIYSGKQVSSTGATATVQANNSMASSGDWAQAQSSHIVQVVKTALLNSSSLNDVIAEI